MGLFDKLKPKYKNNDSEIRKQGVLELVNDKKNIVKNQKILMDLAKNDPSSEVRIVAIENVIGDSSVRYAALNDSDSKVRNVAVNRLDDFIDGSLFNYLIPAGDGKSEPQSIKEILENIADNDSSDEVRQSAKKIIEKYKNDTQLEVKETGSTIENVYWNEDIKIKKSYLSTEDYIYTNSSDISKYLLFGTLNEGYKYTVKDGETILDTDLTEEEIELLNKSLRKLVDNNE